MEKERSSTWFKSFIDHLRALIKEPPYVQIFFISPILFIFSAFQISLRIIFIKILLYSIFGIIWRHAIKDIRGRIGKVYPDNFLKINLWLTASYQIINLIAFVILISFIY